MEFFFLIRALNTSFHMLIMQCGKLCHPSFSLTHALEDENFMPKSLLRLFGHSYFLGLVLCINKYSIGTNLK